MKEKLPVTRDQRMKEFGWKLNDQGIWAMEAYAFIEKLQDQTIYSRLNTPRNWIIPISKK